MAALQKMSQSYRLATTHSRRVSHDEFGWMRQQLPEELGDCYSERLTLDNDLMLLRSRYHATRNLIEETANPHNRPMLVITFGIQGDSGYKGADGSAVAFRSGFTTITAFQQSQGERYYEAGATVSQLRLLIGESLLNTYIGEQRTDQLLGNGNVRQLAFKKTSAASASHVTALARYLNQGATTKLDMHIHTLTVLSEQLKLLSPPARDKSLQISAVDIEKLDRARDIMVEHMDQPLTIPYLCAAVTTPASPITCSPTASTSSPTTTVASANPAVARCAASKPRGRTGAYWISKRCCSEHSGIFRGSR